MENKKIYISKNQVVYAYNKGIVSGSILNCSDDELEVQIKDVLEEKYYHISYYIKDTYIQLYCEKYEIVKL